jgi:hypothetical protein
VSPLDIEDRAEHDPRSKGGASMNNDFRLEHCRAIAADLEAQMGW